MKTLNASSNNNTVVRQPVIIEDKDPCWYANVEKGDSVKDNVWKVGVSHPDGTVEEYSFKFTKVGRDKDSLERASSGEFGIKLLDTFKSGGEEAVKKWLKDGCP